MANVAKGKRWSNMLSTRARSLSPLRKNDLASSSRSPPENDRPRRLLLDPSEKPTTSMSAFVKSWIKTPNMSSPMLNPKPKVPTMPETPLLTLLMIRMEEILPSFYAKLADPTSNNAAAAAMLMSNQFVSSDDAFSSSSSNKLSSLGYAIPVLQGSWETYISPFLLLAAAEVMAAYDHSSKKALINLKSLYTKIAKDLGVVEQILCDPYILLEIHRASKGDASAIHHVSAASSLTIHLRELRRWTTLRIQMLNCQSSRSLKKIHSSMVEISSNLLQFKKITPLITTLQKEIQLWLWLCEACFSLQECRFRETILPLRRMKVVLGAIEHKTKLHEFFEIAHSEILSILPLYFDRLRESASQMYGFDPSRLGSSSSPVTLDYDSQIVEFLRRSETALALCIVYGDISGDSWPATYLRSSISLTRSGSSAGSLSSRFLGFRDEDASTILDDGSSSSPGPYANQSWPLTEWRELTTILRNEVHPNEMGPAMTFRSKEEDQLTIFHVSSLSTYLWFVAIAKAPPPETYTWIRMARAGNHASSEDDVRTFVDDMASKLRVSSLIDKAWAEQKNRRNISSDTSDGTQMHTKSGRMLSAQELVSEWTESKTQDYLRTLKSHFGLRPQSPMMEPLKSPYQKSLHTHERKGRTLYRKKAAMEESAAAWFLGPDIFNMMMERKLTLPSPSD